MDNQHKMIAGYRDLSKSEIDSINEIKLSEKALGEMWNAISDNSSFTLDTRWMSIAKTHFEEGFSAFVRAVAKPEPRF